MSFAKKNDPSQSEDGVRETQVVLNSDPYRLGSLHRELVVRFKFSLKYRACFYENCSAMSDSDSIDYIIKNLTTNWLRDCHESTLNDF